MSLCSIFPKPFQRFHLGARGKPLKRLRKIISDLITWLKPGENESVTLSLTAHRSLLTFLLLSAFCLLPSAFSQSQPTPTPTATPAPSPSPSPTPPPNLHQCVAVTSFHGLPSARTH